MSNHERIAIVGTAQSWKHTPWTDPGLQIWSLNDAYRIQGFQRADRWYDLHPIDKFFALPPEVKGIYPHQIPAGWYVRPQGHLEWLAAQSIPVFLSRPEDHEPPESYDFPTWPSARAFPKTEIQAAFGQYFTSSPAWMIAHAVLEGVKELHIYGIHLATEHEYIEQRPNFEYLIGRVLGCGTMTTTMKNGLRWYETKDGVVILPEASPILNSNFQYAFQVRPNAKLEPLKWDVHRYTVKTNRAVKALIDAPWWTSKTPLRAELAKCQAYQADAADQLGRAHLAQQWT